MSDICPKCNGSGRELCVFCNGFSKKPMGDSCPYCNGTGSTICKSCGGSGKSLLDMSKNG